MLVVLRIMERMDQMLVVELDELRRGRHGEPPYLVPVFPFLETCGATIPPRARHVKVVEVALSSAELAAVPHPSHPRALRPGDGPLRRTALRLKGRGEGGATLASLKATT